jgi:hypothetical protein
VLGRRVGIGGGTGGDILFGEDVDFLFNFSLASINFSTNGLEPFLLPSKNLGEEFFNFLFKKLGEDFLRRIGGIGGGAGGDFGLGGADGDLALGGADGDLDRKSVV